MNNFSFDDPNSMQSSAFINWGYMRVQDGYYLPTVNFEALQGLLKINAYHTAMLHFKKNMIYRWYKSTPFLDAETLNKAAFDFVVLANCYFQVHRNGLGAAARLSYLPALNMRKSVKPDIYVQLIDGVVIEYAAGEIIHLKETNAGQDIYGVPQYMGGIQSILLSNDATKFRRKYYENGANNGYILVTNDANIGTDTANKLLQVLGGIGTGIKNFYINIAKSSAIEPVKVIPINNKAINDQFKVIKYITEAEMCACHRIPASLAAVMPNNMGHLSVIKNQLKLYQAIEIPALQNVFIRINNLVGRDVVQFADFEDEQ